METPTPASRQDGNALFNSQPPAHRRVRIAQDTIEQILGGSFTASSRNYLKIDEATDDLQRYLLDGGTCEVCAIGGLLASRARLGNKVHLRGSGTMREYAVSLLQNEFSREMLDLVEGFYERTDNYLRVVEEAVGRVIDKPEFSILDPDTWTRNGRTELLKKAIERSAAVSAWHSLTCLTPELRMAWVMRNIIHNKGEFRVGELHVRA